MKLEINKKSGVLSVAIDGRLDTVTAPELESALANNYCDTTELVIDCEKLIYISSAGLRVLLSAHKRMKGAMKLCKVGEVVMEVLEMTGFADIWEIVR
jgi:anti-sigma B factor antagonist